MAHIEKRHVRGRTITTSFDDDGNRKDLEHEFNDYVPVDIVDSYIADSKSKGWMDVRVVADVHDAGPAGDDGPTHYPAHLTRKGA